MAHDYKSKSPEGSRKRPIQRRSAPDLLMGEDTPNHVASLSQSQVSPVEIRRMQSLVGNRQVQRIIADRHIQRAGGGLGALDALLDSAIESTTAYHLWIGEGNSVAEWSKATPAQKKPYLDKAKKHIETVKLLKAADGFKALKIDEQEKLLNLVEGTNLELSVPANLQIRTLLDTPTAANDPKKPAMFRKFMKDQGWLPGVVAPNAKTFKGKVKAYKINGPTEVKKYKFTSKKVDANKYEVEIGKIKVPVYFPKTPDASAGEFHTTDEVATGLATLPDVELAAVKQVNVEPARNPDDPYWAKKYKDKNFRSYMTAGSDGIISIYPSKNKTSQDYLQGTMIHETGHALSNKKWGEDAEKDKGWKPWRTAMKKDGFVASQYAKASVAEDFAEALQLYEQVHGKPQEYEIEQIMPERVKLIRKLLSGK
jgi:hypothetical protein